MLILVIISFELIPKFDIGRSITLKTLNKIIMKALITALLLPAALFSQTESVEKMNIVKTNVTGYVFRNINLTYERVISQRFSVAVGFGTVAKGGIPFSKSFIDDTEFSDAEISQTNFTLEPRIYIGQGYGRGFYFAPYYRHTSFNVEQVALNIDYSGEKVPTNISGEANGNSAGLMVGTQWFLGKTDSWVLDWWIAGAHYGAGKGDFRAGSARILTTEEQAELKREIEDLDIPYVDYTVTTDPNGANIKVDGPWAGLRTGLSIGYRF